MKLNDYYYRIDPNPAKLDWYSWREICEMRRGGLDFKITEKRPVDLTVDTTSAERDAADLAEFVARFADQDADYRDWTATRESDRPL